MRFECERCGLQWNQCAGACPRCHAYTIGWGDGVSRDEVWLVTTFLFGLAKFDHKRELGSEHLHGYDPTYEHGRYHDGMASLSEHFVARTLGRRWMSDQFHPDPPWQGDVHGGIQARWSANIGIKGMWLYEHELDWQPWVFLLGPQPPLQIVGWCYGFEGKKPEFWNAYARQPTYQVPPSYLRGRDVHDLDEGKWSDPRGLSVAEGGTEGRGDGDGVIILPRREAKGAVYGEEECSHRQEVAREERRRRMQQMKLFT